MIFVSLSIEKIKIPALTVPLLSQLTSCIPNNLIHIFLYLANSLAVAAAAAVSDCAVYWILTFQVPNLVSLFCCLVRTKVSVQVQVFLC
jgi:hypothetical protein